jgi:hypothetical protein
MVTLRLKDIWPTIDEEMAKLYRLAKNNLPK